MVLEELSKRKKPMRPRRFEAPGMTQSVTLGGGFGQIGRIQAACEGLLCLNSAAKPHQKLTIDKSI